MEDKRNCYAMLTKVSCVFVATTVKQNALFQLTAVLMFDMVLCVKGVYA